VGTIAIRLVYQTKECGGRQWTWIESPDMPELIIAYIDVERAVSVIVPLVRILLYRNRKVLTDDISFDAEELLRSGASTLTLTLADGPRKAATIPDGSGAFYHTDRGTTFMVPIERSFGGEMVHPDIKEKARVIDH